MGLSKEELIHLLNVEIQDAERDLQVIDIEIEDAVKEIRVRNSDLDSLLNQRLKIVEKAIQLREELNRANA